MRPPQSAARDAKAHRVYLQPAGLPAPHDGVCVFDPGYPCMSETLLPILTLLTLCPQAISGTVCTQREGLAWAQDLSPRTSNRARQGDPHFPSPGATEPQKTPHSHCPSPGVQGVRRSSGPQDAGFPAKTMPPFRLPPADGRCSRICPPHPQTAETNISGSRFLRTLPAEAVTSIRGRRKRPRPYGPQGSFRSLCCKQ